MHVEHLTDDFAVTRQLTIKEVSLASAMGFHTIICNRPNGEDPAQPLFEQIAAASELSGVDAVYIPVQPSGPTDHDIAEFKTALDGARKPVLAYCATGKRSMALFDAAAR